MPLPSADQAWPPLQMQHAYDKMTEWAAWYSGDPSRLIQVYNQVLSPQSGVPWWRFWSRANQGRDGTSQRAQIHVPLASDLAGCQVGYGSGVFRGIIAGNGFSRGLDQGGVRGGIGRARIDHTLHDFRERKIRRAREDLI